MILGEKQCEGGQCRGICLKGMLIENQNPELLRFPLGGKCNQSRKIWFRGGGVEENSSGTEGAVMYMYDISRQQRSE
jgi:hypothetical protein